MIWARWARLDIHLVKHHPHALRLPYLLHLHHWECHALPRRPRISPVAQLAGRDQGFLRPLLGQSRCLNIQHWCDVYLNWEDCVSQLDGKTGLYFVRWKEPLPRLQSGLHRHLHRH